MPAEGSAEGECGWGLFLKADYLYAKPRRDTQDFAILDPVNNNVPVGAIQSLDWEWRSGLRAGGGLRLPGEGWEAGIFYTYLHDAVSGSVTAPDGGILFATLTHPGTVEQVTSADAASSFNYHVFDLEIGRHFKACPSLDLRLFGGARFARIDQRFNVLYDGGDANIDFVSTRLNFNGGGARLGAEGDWAFLGNLSLFTRAAGSLVLGEFSSHVAETNNAGATTLVDVSQRFDKVVPVLELAVGVAWRYKELRVSAGYEFTNWFGLVDQPDFVDDLHQGKFSRRISDVSLDGLVARLEWEF
jgi:hypothetical protein